MSEGHAFDEAIALEWQGEHLARGRTHDGWRNFIGPFGGLTAAQAMQAILSHPQRLGDPIAFTVNFAAAVADGAFDVIAQPVRTNRSTQHWSLQIRQGDEVVLVGTAMTAIRRDTWSTEEARMPGVPRPADVPPPSSEPRVEWVKRYDLRFIEGGFPAEWHGGDSGQSLTRLWVRDNPPRPLDFASLTAMSDIFFPRIWLRRAQFGPLGTVTMTVYFHAREGQLEETGTGYLLGQTRGQGFGAGYFDHTAQLWNEAGTLLATTTQVYYFKE
ncbi:MAG TPA: thioesterase family protein [Ramlibacter sp.]|nr:thioesterase family protein [Ramlibacter sp.]